MDKKKAIKIVTASTIAASAFVTANPYAFEASTNVDAVVKNAKTTIKGAYLAYNGVVKTGKLVDVKVVQEAIKKADAEYKKAVAEVKKNGGKKKDALLADLEATYKTYVTNGAKKYVAAYPALTALNKVEKLVNDAVATKDLAKVKAAYDRLVSEVKKAQNATKAVYGSDARAAFVKSANATIASLKNDTTAYVALTKAQDAVSKEDFATAQAMLDKAAASLAKATSLKAELTALNDTVKASFEEKFGTPKVESVSAITETTVTVVLEKAPNKELTPSAFKVAGNTVTKVEKGNYDTIYTLTLGTSLNGTKGTLNVNGVEKAYDFTQLKLESVKAKNLRQLEIKFSKEIDVAGLTANSDGTYSAGSILDNLHIWMTKEEVGAVKTNSFASILGSNKSDWKATLGADKKTLIVESTDGSLLTDNAGTGLGLKLNETYEVEAKDILDATGKYSDVSYVSEILKDDVRPTVSASASVYTSGAGANTLTLTFSEPVKQLLATNNPVSKAKIYIDGSEVPAAAITDVVTNNTVAKHSTVTIDTTKLGFELSKGTHKVAVVGVEDLNGNLLSNNAQELTFNVVDPADVQVVEPVVNNIVQIADNAFKVVFNTTGVVPNSSNGTDKILTIKNGAYDSVTNAYKDIDFTVNDFVVAGSQPSKGKVTAVEVGATSTTPAHTEWIVIVDATADVDATKLSYKGANVITRDIDVIDYKNASKAGKKVTKSLSFTKDVTAPVVSTVNKTGKAKIGVKFSDNPFTTDGNGLVELVAGKKVTVKYTDKDGVTYSEEVTPALSADKVTLELTLTNTKMLDNSGDLFAGATYTIVLPDAVVKDTEEDLDADSTADYVLLDGKHPFVGKTITYTVPGSSTLGKVPQTTKGLIFTGSEVKNGIGGTFVQNVKDTNALTLKDNQIVVVFEGEVDPKTATVSNNYLLGGKVLPAATTIEYRQANIDGQTGEENFVIITLPDNVVALTGGQDFTVSGVANKAGNKMMPVSDIVQLTDNTQPVPASITVRDSNKLVLTFPEEIVLKTSDMTQLARNFKITANGKVVSLLSAAVEDRTKLVITTADNFDNAGSLNVPVSIELKLDSDGNMFIEDLAGNKAKATTITKN